MIMAKSRVAPLKQTTMSRMELQAAVKAVEMDGFIRSQLTISVQASEFWTGSETVLKYIQNDQKRFKLFVANRIQRIREATNPSQWHYINSEENPADAASRGQMSKKILQNRLWFHGPKILWESHSNWPRHENPVVSEIDPEVRKEVSAAAIVTDHNSPMDKLINHFSSWTRLAKAVVWILRVKAQLLSIVKRKTQELNNAPVAHQSQFPTPIEIQQAEEIIIKHVQEELIEAGKLKPKYHSKMSPFVENGLIRVGGRLRRSSLPHPLKHPFLIPRHSRVSELIVRHFHQKGLHLGCEYTLSQVRERYWLVGGNSIARKIVKA